MFISPVEGQSVARTSSADAVRVGSLSATTRQRIRTTCGRCTLGVIGELRRRSDRVMNKSGGQ